MTYEIKKYITTQKDVVDELIEVVELLQCKNINHIEFEEIITSYMTDYFELIVKKLDDKKFQLNGTAKKFLGKKRLMLVSKCMERNDIAKLNDVKDGIFTLIEKSS